MPIKNKNYDGVRLSAKLNGQHRISSYVLNISSKEATALNFVDENCNSYILKKEIVDNKLIISRASDNEKGVKLCKKKNSRGYISSYNLNVSEKEAFSSNLIEEGLIKKFYCNIVTKEIIGNKLVVSRAFPQNRGDLYKLILDSKLLEGKRLSKKTLLEFLHSVEGDSESYFKQRDKIYDSVRANGRKSIWYKGRFGFFILNIKVDHNRVIKFVQYVEKSDYDLF